MKTNKRSHIAFFALALMLILPGCSADESPEDQIKAFITLAEEAVEDNRIRDIRKMVAEEYNDGGGRDKKELINYLVYQTLRQQSVHLLTKVDSIDVSTPDTASAIVFAALTGRPVEDITLLPNFQAELYSFQLELRKNNGQWQLFSAHWKPADIKEIFQLE